MKSLLYIPKLKIIGLFLLLSSYSFNNITAQCYFTLTGDTTNLKTCKFALENVVWKNLTGTVAAQNDIIKIGGINNWDADAISVNKVYNNGFMQTIVVETNTNRMIGLNTVNSNASYTDLEYAFFLQSGGGLTIYENGTSRGTWGAYQTGDTLRIAVMNNKVFYIQNNNIIYSSTTTPTLPMFVDISISTVNGTLQKVVVGNGTETLFTVFESNPGATPTYQWKLNGGNVGAGGTTYNNSLSNGDLLECVLTPSLGGCSGSSVVSNQINIKSLPINRDINYFIQNDSILSGSCKIFEEKIRWESISCTYVNGSNNVSKATGSNNWDVGAFSFNKVVNGGYLQTIVNETTTNRMIGLNAVNTNVSYTDIDYAFYLVAGGALNIYENGASKGAWGAYSTGDTLRIAVVGNQVRYIQNGSIVYTSTVAPTLPLFVDMSLSTVGGTLQNISVANPAYGRFIASTPGLANVNYQWKVNGGNVGSNSPSYTNTALTTNDVVTCYFYINGSTQCGTDTSFTSNAITVQDQTPKKNLIFSVRNDSTITPSCKYAFEEVAWQSISGLTLNGTNNVTKTTGTNSWDVGGFSYNKVEDGGFMQTIVNETNTSRMIGLNAVNANVSYTDIDYAFYLVAGGSLNIYENGASKGAWGAYSTGDTLRIAVVGNQVRYIQNGSIVYTSTVAPTLPLFVDMSLSTVGSTLEKIYVNNTSYGVYSAFVSGFSSVKYQWKLNGANVGTDNPIYTNTTTTNGDTIYCLLTLTNTSGCSADTTTLSNKIIINEQSLINSVLFSIRNDSIVEYSCLFANEEVAWQSLSGLTLSGTNNVTKTSGTSGWDVGGFSYNKVTNGGFMQTIVNETNTSRMIGLNAVNTNVSYTDIDYAFFLVAGGALNIYENGSSRGAWGIYSTGDTLRVAVVNNQVLYIQNGNIIYTSSIAPTLPLYVDMSLSTVGSTLKNITVYNGLYGKFSAFVDGASSVSYQWKVNGGNVGSNSPTYTNTTLTNGDIVNCLLSINGTSGCSDTLISSNNIRINSEPLNNFVTFYITREATGRNGCQFAVEDVSWQTVSGVSKNNNNISKLGGANSWDAGAFSFNSVKSNGFFQFVATETNKSRMIGLNAVNINMSYTDIDYAFYLVAGGGLSIYENGASRGAFGTFTTNDTLRIDISGSTVKYLKNNNVIYTSSIAPTFPLYVDASINTVGGTFNGAKVGNATHGNFIAVANNTGNTPTYQWKLNGSNVGSNSASYSNDTLKQNDQITCVVTASFVNCSASTFTSNKIVINDNPPLNFIPSFTPTTSTWLGNNTNWFDPTNWTAGVPRSGYKAVIPGSLGNYPNIPNRAYLYDLDVANGASITLSSNAHLSIYDEWKNNAGVFNTNIGLVEFKTCVDTSRWNSTNPINVYQMKVNNKKGLVINNGIMHITDSLFFANGIIYNNNNEIVFNDNTKWKGASVSSHIDGVAQKTGNDAFTFPLGDAGYYNPIGISAPAVVTDEFKAKFNRAIPSNRTSLDPSLDHVSSVDYWDLDRVTGSSTLTVTLYWNSIDHGITTLSDLVVSHYDGGTTEWENMGGLAAGSASAGSVISTVTFTSFSPVTFGSKTGINPLPIELTSFNANLVNKTVELDWQTETEINNDYFTVEKSNNTVVWEELTTVKGAGNSNYKINYKTIDQNPLEGISYYRLKQTDFNGEYSYSDIQVINNKGVKDISVYPNPVKNSLNVDYALCDNCVIKIYSSLGQKIYEGTESTINTSLWANGIYELIIFNSAGEIEDKVKIIK